jgi:roadblock/LC7 domain-containing protein
VQQAVIQPRELGLLEGLTARFTLSERWNPRRDPVQWKAALREWQQDLEGGPAVSEFDELVAVDGVLMAGRFGPDGRVAEYKANPWFVRNPVTAEMAHWFCTSITMMFGSMAYAIDVVTRTGFDLPSWLPMKAWAYTGGAYMIAVRGDRFIIAERDKLASLDELDRIDDLFQGQSKTGG